MGEKLLKFVDRVSKYRLTPQQILVLGFIGLIILGAFLLMLPISSEHGKELSFVNALFTATSAACVTGLVVVDTQTYFSFFGQMVILFLIQIGALGIMTLSTVIALLIGKKISLKERMVIQESFSHGTSGGLVRLIITVVKTTLAFEAIGAVFLATRFIPEFGLSKGLYFSVFHSVSAFCNAGFDLMGDFGSLTRYSGDLAVNMTISALIITGGLGFAVVADLYNYSGWRKLSLHSKVVLKVTLMLLIVGTLGVMILEVNNTKTLASMGWFERVIASFFQAVIPRTAGFNSISITDMKHSTLFLMIILMFIGASPGSTGGGIKTTTFAALMAAVWAMVRGKEDVEIYNRRLPNATVYKALAVTVISLMLVVYVTMVLSITEKFSFIKLLFEATSAFSTVGLSTGITPFLSVYGKIILVFTMFAGRLGPITLALAITMKRSKTAVKLPEERIVIG